MLLCCFKTSFNEKNSLNKRNFYFILGLYIILVFSTKINYLTTAYRLQVAMH